MVGQHGDGPVVEDSLIGTRHGIVHHLKTKAVATRGFHADEPFIGCKPHGLPISRNQSVDEIFFHFIDDVSLFAVHIIDAYRRMRTVGHGPEAVVAVGGNGLGAVSHGGIAEDRYWEMLLLQGYRIEKIEIVVGDVIDGMAVDGHIHHPSGVAGQGHRFAGRGIEAPDCFTQKHHIEHAVVVFNDFIR